jgi:hypothetical protein
MSTTFKSILAAAALVGALVLFSAATAERRDIGLQGVTCPAFAWPNSYSACLDDGVRPSGALDDRAAGDRARHNAIIAAAT